MIKLTILQRHTSAVKQSLAKCHKGDQSIRFFGSQQLDGAFVISVSVKIVSLHNFTFMPPSCSWTETITKVKIKRIIYERLNSLFFDVRGLSRAEHYLWPWAVIWNLIFIGVQIFTSGALDTLSVGKVSS